MIKNMDSELKIYWKSIVNTIRDESAFYGSSELSEFVNYVSGLLLEGEEITEDIEYLHYEGTGPSRKKIQIDGYYFDDCDGSVVLYVVPPLMTEDDGPGSMGNDDIRKFLGMAKAFVDESKFIYEHAEESHPAYGLAADLVTENGRFRDIDKFIITIITDNVLTKAATMPSSVKENGKRFEFRIWDLKNLWMLTESQTGRIELKVDLREYTAGKGIPCLLANKTEDYTSYLCSIPGKVIAELYNKYGSRLLEGNIRSFLQIRNKSVNYGIRQTILKAPEKFFIYNNGLTATASDIELVSCVDGLFMTGIKSLQIVNGGQTTASLAMAYLNDRKDKSVECIERISVPMKLTVVGCEQAQTLVPEIAKYANSQNKVNVSDLASNSEFHIRMESISRKLMAPPANGKQYGTYWFYERSRGQYKQETYRKKDTEKKNFTDRNPFNQKISKTDFAKYALIMQRRPDKASFGGEKGFGEYNKGINNDWEKHADNYNEGYFKEIVCTALMFKYVDSVVKRLKYEYKANINAYAVSYLLHLIDAQCPGKVLDFKAIWDAQEVPELVKRQLEANIYIVRNVLIDPDRKVENVTEWAKREACWKLVKEQKTELSDDFIASLMDKGDYLSDKTAAKKEQKKTNAANALVQVFNYGPDKWQALLNWAVDNRELSAAERKLVTKAVNCQKRNPSDSDCLKILNVLDHARDLGYKD